MEANVLLTNHSMTNNLRTNKCYGTNKTQNTDVAVRAMARVANNLITIILGLNSWDIPSKGAARAQSQYWQ